MKFGISIYIGKDEMVALCEELENTENPVVEDFISDILKKASEEAKGCRKIAKKLQDEILVLQTRLNEIDEENPFSFWEGKR